MTRICMTAVLLRRAVACGTCIAVVLVLGAPVGALASEGQPLSIKRFTVQTIARTFEKPVFGHSISGVEFVNEPYSPAFAQAGGHPWALATAIEFETEKKGPITVPTRDVKDIVGTLPVGLLGNPTAVPRCPLVMAVSGRGQCPNDTQVGWWLLHFKGSEVLAPIVNVVPEAGQSAEFALEIIAKAFVTPLLTGHLVRISERTSDGRTRERYGLTLVSKGIPAEQVVGVELTFWGVPADPSHDQLRGLFCQAPSFDLGEPLQCETGTGFAPSGLAAVPFLSMPTACSSGAEGSTLRVDSWLEPGSVVGGVYEGFAEASSVLPGVTGCDHLKFEPTIEVQPDTLLADEPVGVDVNITVPQPEQPGTDATPHLRDAVVTLPEGMSISPGVVDGVQACNATGPEGINMKGPESEEVGIDGELQLAPGHCPDASTVGTAEAITPVLPAPVKGHVYLARPGCGDSGQAACTEQDALDGNLYQLYLELGGVGVFADTGVNIKVPGFVEANPATGQLTTKFLDNPQLPFSELKVHLNGGPRAPLDNPATCGRAVTTSDFTPWSAPGTTPEGLLVTGTPNATPSSSFTVTGCTYPTPFAPGFTAGTVTPQAGQFSSFTMNVSRADREQFVKGLQIHTPPGLLAMLSSVPLCPETQANDPNAYGQCTGSKIGTTRVATGAGSHPFEIEGNVYLTGPYKGAPFGLSVVTHAVAGPFDLGLVVVRVRIDIDPNDSTAIITTDETGPYALPQIIFGVPLRLQRVTVNIDRPGFMFNPTNCGAQQVTAKVSGNQSTVASVQSPFAVAGCGSLQFKPRFVVSTSGRTSRKSGASLDAKLSYPKGAMGNDANIARVKVSLPKQLPSYLPTLQKACQAATFASDPAACPSASVVGIARATTPLLPVGLSGPVYFVSHGGQEFPSLIVVLQGDGVRVDLTGSTFISKGITSSTFKTIPDVPVNTFELYLPQRASHALAANGNLCKIKTDLKMPSEFIAQNGMVFKQDTNINVTGCPKAKNARTAHKATTRTDTQPASSSGRTGR